MSSTVQVVVSLALIGQVIAGVLWWFRSRVPEPPFGSADAGRAPSVVLLKVVLATDAGTLERCRSWVRSAAAYPGRASVVLSTTEASRSALASFARDVSEVDVHLVSCSESERRRESGLDKAHRLAAAESKVQEVLGEDDGVILISDEDTEALSSRSVERLVAGAARPGSIATLYYPSTPRAKAPWWRRAADANMTFNNAVYVLGSIWFGRLQAVFLGWTTAIWASDLHKAGGFSIATGTVSEDASLGRELARHRVGTRLYSPCEVMGITEGHNSFRELWDQQLRWRALLRGCHPLLLGLITLVLPLNFPILLASLAFGVSPNLWTGAVLISAVLVSCWTLAVPLRRVWVVPCHEILMLTFQLAGMLTRRLRWGPWEYEIDARSRITGKRWLPAPSLNPMESKATGLRRIGGQ